MLFSLFHFQLIRHRFSSLGVQSAESSMEKIVVRLSHEINEKIIISVFSQPIITLFVRKFMAIVVNKRHSLKQ